MAQKNRSCLACQTKYSYCPNCSSADKLHPWKANFCSETCMTLWKTLTRFNMGTVTKSEAKEIISALDIRPISEYVSCVQRDYAKLMAEEKKPKRGKRIEIKSIDEVIDTELSVLETVVKESHEVVETNENA